MTLFKVDWSLYIFYVNRESERKVRLLPRKRSIVTELLKGINESASDQHSSSGVVEKRSREEKRMRQSQSQNIKADYRKDSPQALGFCIVVHTFIVSTVGRPGLANPGRRGRWLGVVWPVVRADGQTILRHQHGPLRPVASDFHSVSFVSPYRQPTCMKAESRC